MSDPWLKPLHPQLNLPYGEWIVISEQESAGAIWYNRFDPSTMHLINELAEKRLVWVFHRRKIRVDPKADPRCFERVMWIVRPAELFTSKVS
jgi:hypothetical protein